VIAPASILEICLIGWLGAFAALIAYKFLTGQISTGGLLADQPGNGLQADRLQMLVGTIAGAAAYVGLAAKAGGFPEVPDWMLMLLGGSQGIYLYGKKLRSP